MGLDGNEGEKKSKFSVPVWTKDGPLAAGEEPPPRPVTSCCGELHL